MSSSMFRGEVIEIEGRSLTLALTVVDGQSIAGVSAESMPQSAAFGLQLLVETTWTAEDVEPRLQAPRDAVGDEQRAPHGAAARGDRGGFVRGQRDALLWRGV